MAPETPIPQTSQEQSIKERKRELFEVRESAPLEHRDSFQAHLRDTPAAPLSGLEKGILWSVGVLLMLLLVAALSKGRAPRTGRPAGAKKAASLPGSATRLAVSLRATGPGGAREPVPATPERAWGAAGTGPGV